MDLPIRYNILHMQHDDTLKSINKIQSQQKLPPQIASGISNLVNSAFDQVQQERNSGHANIQIAKNHKNIIDYYITDFTWQFRTHVNQMCGIESRSRTPSTAPPSLAP